MYLTDDSELYHWGVKGMKWGVRRYQNKDGTLTNAGKKHYSAEMEKVRAEAKVIANKKRTAAKLAKLDEMKKKNAAEAAELDAMTKPSKKTKEVPVKKTISQMSDDELANYKTRLSMEKDAYDLEQKISQLNPPKESAAKKLVSNYGPVVADKMWNDVAKPYLNKYLEDKFKVEKPVSELDKLKKEAEIWKQKASIAKDKKNYGDDMEKLKQGEKRRRKEEKKAKKKDKEGSGGDS